MLSPLQINSGLFIPTTSVWDVDRLYDVDVNKPEFKELLVRLYQNINNIVLALNIKDSGYYSLNEFVNGQVFFPNAALTNPDSNGRQVFRSVVNFGPLPNASTISQPHNINVLPTFIFTRIYGCATKPDPVSPKFIPLPYSSATSVNDNIEVTVDATNVNIITGANYSSYTITYVILEYLKE